jgi:integrase/recombinase XerD
LTQQEYQKIRAVVGPERERDRAVFLANTGLRVSEFCGLAANDISPDFSSLSIVGKGRKRRIVPLNKRCQELMRKYEGKINYHKGRPIEVRRIRYECRMLAERAGIPRFGPHSLRHHFTTELVLKNVSLPKVARLLGHASTRTTEQVYLHILPEDMRDVTECLIA